MEFYGKLKNNKNEKLIETKRFDFFKFFSIEHKNFAIQSHSILNSSLMFD